MSRDNLHRLARDLAEPLEAEPEATDALADEASRAAKTSANVLGRYVLLSEAGCGAAGTVYRAYDQVLKRLAAVKIISALGLEEDRLLGLEQEFLAMGRLQHPNVVAIYDGGVVGERLFYAMEWMPERSLQEAAVDAPFKPRQAAEIVRDIARALDYVHREGLVHQDVKPSNILLAGGVPKLADFGAMRRLLPLQAGAAEEATRGTPGFMAPEQQEGRISEIDQRTDVYGLGATLRWLLSGGEEGQECADKTLARIVREATRAESTQRYPSAGAMADDLTTWLDRRPAKLGRRAAAGSVGALLLLLLLGLTISYGPARSTAPELPETRHERDFKPASFTYLLQAENKHRTRGAAVRALTQCGRDLVILDTSYSENLPWTGAELRTIHAGKTGRRIVAYLSIGHAEDYRAYWREGWDADEDGRPDAGAPTWLALKDPGEDGDYQVKFWREGWQQLTLSLVDDLVKEGFDGLYLDGADAFEEFEQHQASVNPETGNGYREDMIAFVKIIAAHARGRAKGPFLIIPQNSVQLLDDEGYLQTISAQGVEDLFTLDDAEQDPEETAEVLDFLRLVQTAGKPVFAVEYPLSAELDALATREAEKHGLILLKSERKLETLGEP